MFATTWGPICSIYLLLIHVHRDQASIVRHGGRHRPSWPVTPGGPTTAALVAGAVPPPWRRRCLRLWPPSRCGRHRIASFRFCPALAAITCYAVILVFPPGGQVTKRSTTLATRRRLNRAGVRPVVFCAGRHGGVLATSDPRRGRRLSVVDMRPASRIRSRRVHCAGAQPRTGDLRGGGCRSPLRQRAMPLVGELLALHTGTSEIALMSSCIVAAQVDGAGMYVVGPGLTQWGRKPTFCVRCLTARGFLHVVG